MIIIIPLPGYEFIVRSMAIVNMNKAHSETIICAQLKSIQSILAAIGKFRIASGTNRKHMSFTIFDASRLKCRMWMKRICTNKYYILRIVWCLFEDWIGSDVDRKRLIGEWVAVFCNLEFILCVIRNHSTKRTPIIKRNKLLKSHPLVRAMRRG